MLSVSLFSNETHNILSLKRKQNVLLQSFCCFLLPANYLDVMSFYIYLKKKTSYFVTLKLCRFLPCGVENNIVRLRFFKVLYRSYEFQSEANVRLKQCWKYFNMMSVCLIVWKIGVERNQRWIPDVCWWIVPSPETKRDELRSVGLMNTSDVISDLLSI